MLVQHAVGTAAGPILGWKTKPLPMGKNKLVQQAIGPTAGTIAGWRTKPLLLGSTNLPSRPLVQLLDPSWAGGLNRSPIWKYKLVQQAIGPAAGPIVGWRIKPLPYWEEQACTADHWSSCWTHTWAGRLSRSQLGKPSLFSRPLVQLLDP